MGTTANYSFPYPADGTPRNTGKAFKALATAVDTALDTVEDSIVTGGDGGGEPLVIYVTDHGATGNGTSDDTAAIQAALDAVPATGAKVIFPKGSYKVTAPLVIKSYTHIQGCEPASRYWLYSTSSPTSVCNVFAGDSFTGASIWQINSGITAFSFTDITTNGRHIGSVNGFGFPTSSGGTEQNSVIRNCAIIRMGGDGIRGYVWAGRWDSIFIGSCNGWGLNATVSFLDLHVHNSYITGNVTGGMQLNGTANSGLCSFIGVRFERSGWNPDAPSSPVGTTGPGIKLRRCNDTKFVSCETDANAGHGIDISCSTPSHMYNVHFIGCSIKRDGFGTMAGASPGNFAGIKVVGDAPSTAEVGHVSFIDCDVQVSKAADGSGLPDYTHPKYGVWMENTSWMRFIGGRYEGQTKVFYSGANPSFATTNYRPQIMLHHAATMTTPLGSTGSRPTEPFQGQQFYDTTIAAPVWWTGSAWTTWSSSTGQKVLATKTGAYTLTGSDNVIVATSGTWNATLPTAVSASGKEYVIKNSGTGVITVNTTSSQTIDGELTFTLAQHESVTVVSNGTNWVII